MFRRRRIRRAISLTPLIDVIFLLLLFFMLSSTFSKFAEVELSAAIAGAVSAPESPPLFLQLRSDDLRLNGEAMALAELAPLLRARSSETDSPQQLLIALDGAVTAQRLADLLVTLRDIPGLAPTVLGGA